ncbi:AAA ATPase-like protein [Ruminiclostridium sufflavum DSM 19573]|uniref:AAA ATPase-like protein n=1 Tax=Ruminiclostridium sufflavum DSM 19573 TaxID=1121337 RepID=A0A318Y3B6_9FIRM|nr:AAA family ATPase [Ruminiclostridium sufflavum]PYG89927.1 AAA ATPase-like protein [Ruminiclostridium sufflavum DSM 19573]
MKSFRLKNIKGFVDTGKIEIKPITVIVGENSSGKSSISRFPLVLKQTFLDAASVPILLYGSLTDYGNYEDVVFNHRKGEVIEFEVTFSYNEFRRSSLRPLIADDQFDKFMDSDMILKTCIIHKDGKMAVNGFVLSLTSREEPIVEFTSNDYTSSLIFNINGYEEHLIDPEEYFFDKFIPDIRCMLDNSNTDRINNARYNSNLELASQICNTLQNYFNMLANKIFYIDSMRKTPERFYRYTDSIVDSVGKCGEYAPVILGQEFRHGKNIINKVSDWLSSHMNFALDVEDVEGQLFKIMIRDLKTNARNNLADMGQGLSQLIPILVQTFITKNNKECSRLSRTPNLTVIEQPELYLHPSSQDCLADLFVETIKKENESFFIETHSEHLIRRLVKFIDEGALSSDEIAIYLTEKDYDGNSKVRKLNMNEYEKIASWTKDAFSKGKSEADEQKVISLKKK